MSKRAFAFLTLLLALCVAGSMLLGKYGFGAEDYARYAKFVSNLTLFIKDDEILASGESEKLINAENIDKIYGINYEIYEDRL